MKLNLLISRAPSLPTVLDAAPIPAQLTTICIEPNSSLVLAIASTMDCSSATLAIVYEESLPRDSDAAFTGIRIYTNNNVSRAEWCLLGMKLS